MADFKQCANCNIEETSELKLKCCGACKTTFYCSKDCQTQDWPTHKAAHRRAKPKSPADFIDSFDQKSWIHQFNEQETFKRLVDCYRIRVEDSYVFGGELTDLYANESPMNEFKEFLTKAESRDGILPSW